MEQTAQIKECAHTVAGIVAHVDAGKTTLAESMLYLTGGTRKLGRVDHKDAFLDTYELEKNRGITIFSKQAELNLKNRKLTLLDTPGHVDFSAEMERTLQVLDYAILVISVADGVSGHVQTLWRLLKQYNVPVFLFINKMDQPGADKEETLLQLQKRLDGRCVDFSDLENFDERLAETDEELLEQFFETGKIRLEHIKKQIKDRKLFPCYFGSALKMQGITEFLEGFEMYTTVPVYGDLFGARVFKIARDAQGKRLTYLKVTGGVLKAKQVIGEEKIDQIRVYSGASFTSVSEAQPGMVCAVTGLNDTVTGQGLGCEIQAQTPILEPVLTYCVSFSPEIDIHEMYRKLSVLEEEEPQLQLVWQEETSEIHARVMGEVQIEILQSLIRERFGVEAFFTSGSIIYKETVENTVEGIGHFEPLRHYAEVHLLIEPGEPGSGMVYETNCSEDLLSKNWQRLIITHLEEKKHKGVLTGSELTDTKITLIAGRAHIKHTEGGDFRQATYRAVRQGLKSAESLLLEPWYSFVLEVPSEQVGRAMSDIGQMNGSFEGPEAEDKQGMVRLTGTAPASEMRDYQREVWAYTKGRGRITLTLKGYEPCHNAEEVIEEIGYDSERDVDNPTGSVFCAHGAGFLVKWDEVPEYMHIKEDFLAEKPGIEQDEVMAVRMGNHCNYSGGYSSSYDDDPELLTIMEREFGSKQKERDRYSSYRKQTVSTPVRHTTVIKENEPKKEYLLVDGYNIIFAWEELNELAKASIDAARNKLMDILSNYQGFIGCTLILVFDAYKVKGNQGEVQKYHNIYVVYTKEAETADQYIEKTTHEIGRKYKVTVATSDALEQVIVMGQGAYRISARDFYEEVERTEKQIREINERERGEKRNYLLDYTKEEDAREMEKVRLGKTTEK